MHSDTLYCGAVSCEDSNIRSSLRVGVFKQLFKVTFHLDTNIQIFSERFGESRNGPVALTLNIFMKNMNM